MATVNKIDLNGDTYDIESSALVTTQPTTPTEGAVYYDTTNDVVKVYDGTNWNPISGGGGGSGDVVGPNSSTNGHLAVFDGTTGKAIKDGGAIPTVPTKVSDLTNDSGYLTSSTGVTSVNGSHGAVTGLQTTANLKTSLSDNSDSYYPSQKAVKTAVDGKQDSLATQTAYTSKGTATKVPQITTNSLGQVTGITEVTITHPSQVSDTAYASSWNGVTTTAPSKNAVYDKIESLNLPIISATAPSSPTEGMIWYDTTNDKLKTYDGTNWNTAGGGGEEANVKVFTISGQGDTTTGQQIYDYYKAGNTPFVKYNNVVYRLSSYNAGGGSFQLDFLSGFTLPDVISNSYSESSNDLIVISGSNDVVDFTYSMGGDTITYLATDVNYQTPYTPQYNGSPATKKYVDDAVAGATGGGITNNTTGTTTTVTQIWAGTEAQYNALNSYSNTTIYYVF